MSTGEEKNRNKEFRELVRLAFEDARAKGKENWRTMELSVLKNRLLQRTDRRFQEADYGATSMTQLVELLPSELELSMGHQPQVTLIEGAFDSKDADLERQPIGNNEQDAAVTVEENEEVDFQILLDKLRASVDNLGIGEAYASRLKTINEEDIEKTFVIMVSHWASSSPVGAEILSVEDLLSHVDQFVNDQLALALVHGVLRIEDAQRELPVKVGDLYFRVADSLREIYRLTPRTRKKELMQVPMAKTREKLLALSSAVERFCQSPVIAARLPSTEINKQIRAYKQYSLVGERQTLGDIEVLLGPVFRRFCVSCEKYEAGSIPKRARDLRVQLQRVLDSFGVTFDCRLRLEILEPVAKHMSRLIEEGTKSSDEMLMPVVEIAGGTFRLDLARETKNLLFSARVVNKGEGTAHSVDVKADTSSGSATLVMAEPAEPFELEPGTERLIRIELGNAPPGDNLLELEAVLTCETVNRRQHSFKQTLKFMQQATQPDWDDLLRNPPYGIKPISEEKDLYGRDSLLRTLELDVSSETSTFLWGQKRIGKTSVLQVLAAKLRQRSDITCVVLRMGELSSLHEGQLGHRIALRLVEKSGVGLEVPDEDKFGVGLGILVPFVERVVQVCSQKLLVIIDEFDDLNPAFYLGERGKQFVKALRSLSEIGLTFMFVGSERMYSIYHSHSEDLNKWRDRSLDRIEDTADCEALICDPVAGKIEYEKEAVKTIVEYCRGNPYYMCLVASDLLKHCSEVERTFVGTSDFEYVRRSLERKLGQTNFAHFWEDVPVLDPLKKEQSVAENCLFLACVAKQGLGEYESLEELYEGQSELGLKSRDRLPIEVFNKVEIELLRRRVLLTSNQGGNRVVKVELPIFRDWLLANGERELLAVWQTFNDIQTEKDRQEESVLPVIPDPVSFPIDEDQLLPISERLVYLGRQKDVAEIRRCLRQFDDENRIEVAFQLLQRLTETGYVSAGASVIGLTTMVEALNDWRQQVGDGAWKMFRGKKDNLCLGYVDSETKSGATMARELKNRIRPGKCASIREMSNWAMAHLEDDPMLVIVDDFSGTGQTVVKGLKKIWSKSNELYSRLAEEGRMVCCLQTAFPEAIELVESEFPNVKVLAVKQFYESVRLSSASGIFQDESEFKYAQNMMLQIGRQLVPQFPLGFGDSAALVSFHNTIPNNTLPVFWCEGKVNGRKWTPLLPRA